jgi:hypothetical protein
MDDTLPPARVREIGNQVSESPFARELVERIHRVCRQRRLTVPRSSGPEAVDPNLVAGYLDNDLDAEQVADFETQCLNHDVCLAEVASVHQILSLLGQRAKVPTEVKERMYQLVKGREAIREARRGPAANSNSHSNSQVGSGSSSGPGPNSQRARRKNPTGPRFDREGVLRARRDRLAPLAICLASIAILCVSTWYGLSTAMPRAGLPAARTALDEPTADAPEPRPAEAAVAVDDDAPAPVEPSPAMEGLDEDSPAAEVAGSATRPEASEPPRDQPPREAPTPAPPALPPGALGQTRGQDNVLLRYSDEKREWERLIKATPLNRSDRLVCLAPFRATLDLATAGLTMIGGAELRLSAPTATGQSRFEPRMGRFKAVKDSRGDAIALDLGGRESLTISLAATNAVGIERLNRRAYGQPANLAAGWAISCLEGTLSIIQGADTKSFNAPVVVTVNSAGALEQRPGESPPAWVGEADPAPADLELQGQFLRAFHEGRPVLADVVTAIEDGQESIRRLAISALTALGDLSYVLPLLDRKDSPAIRRDAIAALRDYMSRGAEATRQAREQIMDEFGEKNGPMVEKMLIGYTPQEAADPATLRALVDHLGPGTASVGVRELSLDNLSKLTGRDNLGYDPDQPQGNGLSNWKRLVLEGTPDSAPEAADEN